MLSDSKFTKQGVADTDKDSMFCKDSDGNTAIRVVTAQESLPAEQPDSMFTKDINGNTAVRTVGGGGGSVDESHIIVKSDTIPTASSDNLGKFYCYSGATNATYTHGYIYECVKNETYTGTVSFEAATLSGTVVSCSGDDFANFLTESGVSPLSVVSGTMTYDVAGNLWVLVGKNADDETVLSFQEYQEDYEDFGFTFTGTPEDGDVVAFTCTITDASTYSWQRIDVQPNFQYTTMPSATIGNAGKIVQYVGTTDANYINGYFYKCDVVQTPEDFTPTVVSCSASIDLDALKESFGSASNWTHVFAYDSDSQNWYLDSGDTPVQLSDYGIEVQSLSAGATITCVYVAAITTFNWEQVNVQPTPVTSVNGSTGTVVITAEDLGAATAATAVKTLNSANWSNNEQSVYVYGVTASNTVIVSPAPASQADYVAAGIYCSAQANESLTFTCATTPTSNISVNVLILG